MAANRCTRRNGSRHSPEFGTGELNHAGLAHPPDVLLHRNDASTIARAAWSRRLYVDVTGGSSISEPLGMELESAAEWDGGNAMEGLLFTAVGRDA